LKDIVDIAISFRGLVGEDWGDPETLMMLRPVSGKGAEFISGPTR
jgi:hypothetical protein